MWLWGIRHSCHIPYIHLIRDVKIQVDTNYDFPGCTKAQSSDPMDA